MFTNGTALFVKISRGSWIHEWDGAVCYANIPYMFVIVVIFVHMHTKHPPYYTPSTSNRLVCTVIATPVINIIDTQVEESHVPFVMISSDHKSRLLIRDIRTAVLAINAYSDMEASKCRI